MTQCVIQPVEFSQGSCLVLRCGHVVRVGGSPFVKLRSCLTCTYKGDRQTTIRALVTSGDLYVKCPRWVVQANLGVPDSLEVMTRRYPVPMVWRYGNTHMIFPPALDKADAATLGLLYVGAEDENGEVEDLLGTVPLGNAIQIRQAARPDAAGPRSGPNAPGGRDRASDQPDARRGYDGAIPAGVPQQPGASRPIIGG